ncbi:hypothetical protein MEN41_00310 [Dolichospermum sp. ST_con]|nr:hypothetical protein [Dolichospermum sp. ST_con]MDD1418795.1 hypothetical protein [Dolichospermum sp. ST_sed1]MDD1423938.1 hypothetical protein [Dolichospermum sp. ST_sed9]MDD1430401.1 hypothetical protein [Dolichospermum sp. ST_sed6]MDD1437548.1 hypothetical protein [Dolichospermum sp. ST_sed10]MDD1439733.1 hypothetical protein [Dolichospermum sp. ST_sed3]MDD1445673.1 hypothetical protein [Dolichospermum sp. ST_sed8]MDD1453967.1 hypothetical protein [Dolichospermum sp. ST_sed7]MDD145977
MWKDPIVEEIRQTREAHSRQFNYDLKAIYKDLKEQEKKSKRQFASYTQLLKNGFG